MQKTAIISEYNPFHNGHFFQAETARRETEADAIIAVMSGHFMQRGEPASFDKWRRARAAVESGAIDLVVELPTRFAVQRADRFAKAGVALAEMLGCQALSFGSESGQIDAIQRAVHADVESSATYQLAMKEGLARGLSSAKASSLAFSRVHPEFDLSQPNNILGYHYAKSTSSMALHTVKRIGAGYHETRQDAIMSATGIRAHYLQTGETRAVPDATRDMFQRVPMNHWENYWPMLQYKLRTTPLDVLTQLVGIDSSLAPRLIRAGLENSFADAMHVVSTKRYTRTAIQRAFVSVLLHWQQAELPKRFDDITYIRPLAFNETGRHVIREMKSSVDFVNTYDARLEFEARVTEAYRFPINQTRLIEHRQTPAYIDSK